MTRNERDCLRLLTRRESLDGSPDLDLTSELFLYYYYYFLYYYLLIIIIIIIAIDVRDMCRIVFKISEMYANHDVRHQLYFFHDFQRREDVSRDSQTAKLPL